MHAYWFGLFVRMLIYYRKTGEQRDIQNRLDEKEQYAADGSKTGPKKTN